VPTNFDFPESQDEHFQALTNQITAFLAYDCRRQDYQDPVRKLPADSWIMIMVVSSLLVVNMEVKHVSYVNHYRVGEKSRIGGVVCLTGWIKQC
jgi:hypothetical protein